MHCWGPYVGGAADVLSLAWRCEARRPDEATEFDFRGREVPSKAGGDREAREQ